MSRKKSTAEKQKRGTFEDAKQKRIRRVSLKGYPAPMEELNPDETVIYKRLCDHLKDADALHDADAFLLTAAAVNLYQMGRIIPMLRENGTIQHFENGTRNVSPEFSIFEKANGLFIRHSKLLGLDPRSRQDLLIFLENGDQEDDDPFGEFLPGAS